jgi:hypothetical protein
MPNLSSKNLNLPANCAHGPEEGAPYQRRMVLPDLAEGQAMLTFVVGERSLDICHALVKMI